LLQCSTHVDIGADAMHLANSTKHNIISDSDPLTPLCKNMMSSTKLEVH